MGAFGLYTATVTTLASRRQNLFLKRPPSTPAGDAGILAGLMFPATVLASPALATAGLTNSPEHA